MAQIPPVVCTLTEKALVERRLEWTDLAALAVSSQRLANGVRSSYPTMYEADIRDLVERESNCCGTWLDSSVERTNDAIRLELTTRNPEGVAMILSIAGLTS